MVSWLWEWRMSLQMADGDLASELDCLGVPSAGEQNKPALHITTLAYWLFGVKVAWEIVGARKTPWPFFIPVKAGNKSPTWNVPSPYREWKVSLSPETGSSRLWRLLVVHFLTCLLLQAQTSWSCQLCTNLSFLCLKDTKGGCSGHFFKPYVEAVYIRN